MKKVWIHIGLCALVVVLAYGAVANPLSMQYIETLSTRTMKDELRLQIEEHAKKVNIPPQDARVDKVWKALPGYNGLEVDVNQSYDKMKELGHFSQSQLVFKETFPAVHLHDLPPAPTYRGVQEKPMVSLLINVSWGDEYIPDMLKTLQKYDTKATFFLDGSWVKKTPHLAQMIQEEGHEIGSHAYSHPHMNRLSAAKIDEELEKTTEVLQSVLNVTPKWFAPPSGEFNERVIERVAAHNMHTIMWSVDTIDWKKPDPNVMVERVVNQIEAGSMLLMHPTEATSKGLARIIEGIQKKNLQIGTVTELMDEKRIAHKVMTDNNGGTNRD
ncbi:polysaccharide deacetylase family protein [Shouchella lonarensis]|uniref:Probable sporulation protein, polysaccharide deacetylase family n=1 Tax=Shouchella lonarensis TaxID=1464122 RepID=A0A1G6H825_9BACI|nr:polysaccharide deacetylase family protein [Shouchella lonarensis]SDB90371.1 probable sporulation protein, polysaccharide deacetylase family [Shouchella lonarensis]